MIFLFTSIYIIYIWQDMGSLLMLTTSEPKINLNGDFISHRICWWKIRVQSGVPGAKKLKVSSIMYELALIDVYCPQIRFKTFQCSIEGNLKGMKGIFWFCVQTRFIGISNIFCISQFYLIYTKVRVA